MNKRTLTVQALDAQTAVELPDRDMMALIIVVAPIDVDINLEDVNVGVQACAALLAVESPVQCDATQN